MADGLIFSYLLGLVLTGVILTLGFQRSSASERRELNPGVGVIAIVLWPIFWIIVAFAMRKGI